MSKLSHERIEYDKRISRKRDEEGRKNLKTMKFDYSNLNDMRGLLQATKKTNNITEFYGGRS